MKRRPAKLICLTLILTMLALPAWALPHLGWYYCTVYDGSTFSDNNCFFDSDNTILVKHGPVTTWIGNITYNTRNGRYVYTGADRYGRIFVVSPY